MFSLSSDLPAIAKLGRECASIDPRTAAATGEHCGECAGGAGPSLAFAGRPAALQPHALLVHGPAMLMPLLPGEPNKLNPSNFLYLGNDWTQWTMHNAKWSAAEDGAAQGIPHFIRCEWVYTLKEFFNRKKF